MCQNFKKFDQLYNKLCINHGIYTDSLTYYMDK